MNKPTLCRTGLQVRAYCHASATRQTTKHGGSCPVCWDGHVYVRFQSPHPGKRGIHTGVFGLTNGLGRSGDLTAEEHATWRAGNDWYNAAYPDPTTSDPSVYDRSINPQATAWFKITATHLLDRIPEYLEILQAHGVECERVDSDAPGRIIYEDEVQIVVVPRDAPPTGDAP